MNKRVTARKVGGGHIPRLEPMAWWYGQLIPKGNLVLVEGQEGVGKGYFLCWALVQAAAGLWGPPTPGLYISSEEEPPVIQERLLVNGHDPERHAPISVVEVDGGDLLLKLPTDEDIALDLVNDTGAGMVGIDLLRDHCEPPEEMANVRRSNNDETWIRPAARSWQRIASRTGATALATHHQNKLAEGSARSKSTGSIAWRQMARLVIVMGEINGERALAVDKQNIGKADRIPYSYEIDEVTTDFGRFQLGDRLSEYQSIDEWDHALRHPPTYEIDVVDTVAVWCQHEASNGGFIDGDGDLRLPSKDVGQRATHLSREKYQQAVSELIRQGRVVTKPVKNLPGYSKHFWKQNGHQ